MKKLALTLSCILLFHIASAWSQQQKKFEGAWFTVEYPSAFSAKPGLKSKTSIEGVDTAWFVSPDGLVEFYVCSPQWSREPTDFMENSENEVLVGEEHEGAEDSEKETWRFTWKANDGSYSKSIVITREYSAKWAFGLKYRDQESYEKYKKDYIKFKKSLVQYADGEA